MALFLGPALAIAAVAILLWRARRRDVGEAPDRADAAGRIAGHLPDKNIGMIGQPNRGRPWGRGN